MKNFCIFMILTTTLFLFFCEKQSDDYTLKDHFEGNADYTSLNVKGNPFDYACKKIGISYRDIELPVGQDGKYKFACRFPIIDYVSNRPLYMKQWTEDNSEKITSTHRKDGLIAIPHMIEILQGTGDFDPEVLKEIKINTNAFKKALKESNFTPGYQKHLIGLYASFVHAKKLIDKAKANLTKDDLDFFEKNPGYYLIPDGKKMASITGSVKTQMEYLKHARHVKYEYIFHAANIISETITHYVTFTKDSKKENIYIDVDKANETFYFDSPVGKIQISGFGDNKITEDVNLLIDLGGNDTYTNNAGGTKSVNDGIAICIDHSGNDNYLASQKDYVQGVGFLGIGYLIDLDGNDIYEANNFCQGAAIMGVGAIWDKKGNDKYKAKAFCQGAAMFGLGTILEDKGSDLYDCATLGQAGATTLGLGILSDLEGDDKYKLAVDNKTEISDLTGYGQGGAVSFRAFPWKKEFTPYGGVGLLVDDKGNDEYHAKGWCSQGGSYIMSLGALVDNSGNDNYKSSTGLGSPIHITNAIFIDKDGNDKYEAGFRSAGSGADRSPGFFIDYKGDDVYKANGTAYAASCKNLGLSLFIDYEGNDKYEWDGPKPEISKTIGIVLVVYGPHLILILGHILFFLT